MDTPFADVRRALRGHIPALDGIRGLAILLVVVHNAGGPVGESAGALLKLFDVATNVGWVGVQLFFVLSGFLITGILLDTRGAARAWGAFYMRRVLRIFPLYYAALLVAFVGAPLVIGRPAAASPHALAYFLYVSNWSDAIVRGGGGGDLSHFWSLAVEEQFYMVWPILVLTLRPRAFTSIAVLLVAVAPLTRALLLRLGFSPEWAYEGTIGRVDALALGGLAALAVRDERLFNRWAPRLGTLSGALGVAVLAVIGASRGFGRTHPLVQTAGYTLLAAFFTAALLLSVVAAVSRGGLARALEARPLLVLGKYSYGVYVVHLPMLVAIRDGFGIDLGGGGAARRVLVRTGFTALVLAASLVVALVSFYLFEKRFLDLKRYFTAGPRAA